MERILYQAGLHTIIRIAHLYIGLITSLKEVKSALYGKSNLNEYTNCPFQLNIVI